MISYEFLKKQQLLNALDEPFDLFYLIMRIDANFCRNNQALSKEKNLEVIHYFLESGFFEILDPDNSPWNLLPDQAIEKLKRLWEASSIDGEANTDDPKMWLYFKLTPAGRVAAKEYSLKQIYGGEKILLLASEKPYINFYDIIKVVKEMFHLTNTEELYIKILDVASGLWERKRFLEIGDLKDGQFIPWKPDYEKEIDKRWNRLEGEPKNEVAWLRITPEAKKMVEDWKVKGGRIVDEWYTYSALR